jgi:hypothetical protein
MTAQPADGSHLVDLLRRQDQVLDGRDRAMRAAEHEVLAVAAMPWEPLGEAGGIKTDNAGEAVPGEVRQVRFPRPG